METPKNIVWEDSTGNITITYISNGMSGEQFLALLLDRAQDAKQYRLSLPENHPDREIKSAAEDFLDKTAVAFDVALEDFPSTKEKRSLWRWNGSKVVDV